MQTDTDANGRQLCRSDSVLKPVEADWHRTPTGTAQTSHGCRQMPTYVAWTPSNANVQRIVENRCCKDTNSGHRTDANGRHEMLTDNSTYIAWTPTEAAWRPTDVALHWGKLKQTDTNRFWTPMDAAQMPQERHQTSTNAKLTPMDVNGRFTLHKCQQTYSTDTTGTSTDANWYWTPSNAKRH